MITNRENLPQKDGTLLMIKIMLMVMVKMVLQLNMGN